MDQPRSALMQTAEVAAPSLRDAWEGLLRARGLALASLNAEVGARLLEDLRAQQIKAEIVAADGALKRVPLLCRIDTLDELDYFKNGGILQYVLRHLAA